MELKKGQRALIAGGSEGIGEAFAWQLAAKGLDLILVARGLEKLEKVAKEIQQEFAVNVRIINCDLAASNATEQIFNALGDVKVDILVYNAALSFIGPFEEDSLEHQQQIAQANVITPLNMLHHFGGEMVKRKSGSIILMASLAGFQGSGFLTVYAASKAFTRILAESLWYEWKAKGVDVIACCAGATSTPNYIKTNPAASSFFAPRVQTPEEVVAECFQKLGKTPSFITGRGNKVASFIMQRLMPRKMAIKIMGDTTRKIYRL